MLSIKHCFLCASSFQNKAENQQEVKCTCKIMRKNRWIEKWSMFQPRICTEATILPTGLQSFIYRPLVVESEIRNAEKLVSKKVKKKKKERNPWFSKFFSLRTDSDSMSQILTHITGYSRDCRNSFARTQDFTSSNKRCQLTKHHHVSCVRARNSPTHTHSPNKPHS